MSTLSLETLERIRALGIECEQALPAGQVVSATAALACVPMYMVSNVHGWTSETQTKVLDIEGSEAVREAYAIGKEKAGLALDAAHDEVLSGFLKKDHPADRIIYDHALETLRRVLDEAPGDVADKLRVIVASSVVAVARASGKGLLGTGEKVSAEERACIQHIRETLDLDATEAARAALDALG